MSAVSHTCGVLIAHNPEVILKLVLKLSTYFLHAHTHSHS